MNQIPEQNIEELTIYYRTLQGIDPHDDNANGFANNIFKQKAKEATKYFKTLEGPKAEELTSSLNEFSLVTFLAVISAKRNGVPQLGVRVKEFK